jgi:hypothetical protein
MRDLTTDAMDRLAERVQRATRIVHSSTRNRKVRLTVGPFKGRTCRIDGAFIDPTVGEWIFCCMVQRADGKGDLNNGGESAVYHRQRDFEVIE